MDATTMIMIPGALEPRSQSNAVADVMAAPASTLPSVVHSQDANEPTRNPERHELRPWLELTIFAATLIATMWLTMAVF
jgi:hypothetical protein